VTALVYQKGVGKRGRWENTQLNISLIVRASVDPFFEEENIFGGGRSIGEKSKDQSGKKKKQKTSLF